MLKIGAFAKTAAVSIKTLRFYDRVGVLRPAYVNPRSGYRYYRMEQLTALSDLRLLRELGGSVKDLQAWVASREDGSTRRLLLARLREELQCRLDRDHDRLRYLEKLLSHPTSRRNFEPLLAPTVRRIPAVPAVTLRDRVSPKGNDVYRMFESAERAVARQSARAAKRPFLLIHNDPYRGARADVEVCVPIVEPALTSLSGRVVEGARRAACLSFKGSYDRGAATAAALGNWVRSSGEHAVGPLRESYIRFAADQQGYRLPARYLAGGVADLLTELQLPISK